MWFTWNRGGVLRSLGNCLHLFGWHRHWLVDSLEHLCLLHFRSSGPPRARRPRQAMDAGLRGGGLGWGQWPRCRPQRGAGRGTGPRAGGLRWVWAAAVTVPVADNGRLSESGVRVVRPELSGVLGPGAVRVRVGRGAPGFPRPPTPGAAVDLRWRDMTGSAGLTGRDGGVVWRAGCASGRRAERTLSVSLRDGRTRAFCTHL